MTKAVQDAPLLHKKKEASTWNQLESSKCKEKEQPKSARLELIPQQVPNIKELQPCQTSGTYKKNRKKLMFREEHA